MARGDGKPAKPKATAENTDQEGREVGGSMRTGVSRIRIEVTSYELRGLMFVADSFGEHMKEGLGTGSCDDDRRCIAACRLIGRIGDAYHRAARRKRGEG